jgi:SAM-dependent methyltransferase
MAESYPGKLQVWEGWVPTLVRGAARGSGQRGVIGVTPAGDFADRLYDSETLCADGRSRQRAEPFSLQWFLDIESLRHGRHGAWIPRLLEFGKHRGEALLGLGEGVGTDWVQYARHGAEMAVCSPSAEQLAVVQRNFELRGLHGRFLHADMAAVPLEAASVDVVCLSGMPPGPAEPGAVVDEVYRVLKPGGKVLALAPARFDIDFWRRCLLPWESWLRPGRAPRRRGGFSARGLRRLFGRFVEPRTHKRHLRRGEIPHLWRCWPRPVLERLMGRFLVLKAFKALSSAIAVHAAA